MTLTARVDKGISMNQFGDRAEMRATCRQVCRILELLLFANMRLRLFSSIGGREDNAVKTMFSVVKLYAENEYCSSFSFAMNGRKNSTKSVQHCENTQLRRRVRMKEPHKQVFEK